MNLIESDSFSSLKRLKLLDLSKTSLSKIPHLK
jgi:hypothetical protein